MYYCNIILHFRKVHKEGHNPIGREMIQAHQIAALHRLTIIYNKVYEEKQICIQTKRRPLLSADVFDVNMI